LISRKQSGIFAGKLVLSDDLDALIIQELWSFFVFGGNPFADEPVNWTPSNQTNGTRSVSTDETINQPQQSPQDDGGLETEATGWPSDTKSRMRRLEAVLFMSRVPIPSRKLSQLADLEDGTQARTMVDELNRHYDQTGRAFHVKRVAGGFQLRTRPQFADWIRRLDHTPKPNRLSTPALDTLAVVAYRQPIIKAEIEAIRGVSSGEMLRQLLESGLVKIAGRSEKLGRPFLYATSKDFLTQFGFNSLNDLPRAKQLAGQGLPQWASPDENRDQPERVSEPLDNPSTPGPHASPQKEEEE
jgi:segregation and condensation protein B